MAHISLDVLVRIGILSSDILFYVNLYSLFFSFLIQGFDIFFLFAASRSGNVGVVHLIETDKDITWIERSATAGPYTVVLPFQMFSKETLVRLRNTNNINGVLLIRNVSYNISSYSPDDQCPNRYSGYKKCNETKPWNPWGSALLMEDWPFPMFYTEVRYKIISICIWHRRC